MKVVLANASLIDCVNPEPTADATVIVEDGRIAEIRDGGRYTATGEERVIDLRGSFLLPGLWDVHVHFEWPRLTGLTVAEQVVQNYHNAVRGLTEAGVTGIRSAGVAHFSDVALKRAFDSGQHVGPRIFAAGHILTTTAGHAVTNPFTKVCDGPDSFVRAVREQIQNGVDHIKLQMTGGILGPDWDLHHYTFQMEEELEAVFAISHQRGYKVMAHAANPDAVKSALRLKAHTVEHGYIMDEECIQQFLDGDSWYVPTLGITHLTPSQVTTEWEKRYAEQSNLTPQLIRRAEDAAGTHRKWFQRALQAGVKMALGSDRQPLWEGPLLEMGLWVKNGATPWQTLLAATRVAAEVCGVGQDLGTLEVGKLADLIVVRQNPLEDINHLRSLELVFKDGQLVADHRSGVA